MNAPMNLRNYTATVCVSVDYDAMSPWIAAGASGLRDLSRTDLT